MSGTTVTPRMAYDYITAAGVTGDAAVILTACAGAESNYDAAAVGDVALQDATWGPSIGLWQVRSLKAQSGTGGIRDATRLSDPAFNARSAAVIYGQQGLGAWSTYSTGAYRSYLPTAQAVAADAKAGRGGGIDAGTIAAGVGGGLLPGMGAGIIGSGAGLLGGLDAIGGFFGALTNRGTWVRVLEVTGGLVAVVVGLQLLGKPVIGTAASAAADFIPAGRAVKAAGAVAAKASTAGKAVTK